VIAGGGTDEPDLVVTRLNADGTLDTSFGGDGTSAADFGGLEATTSATVQPDGKIVVSGVALDASAQGDFAAARFQPNGLLDRTFNSDGKTSINFGANDGAGATAMQPDGRILLAGTTQGVLNDIALARLEGVDPPPAVPGPAGSPTIVPRCAGRRATIVGTAGRDRLHGTRHADVIVGLAGSDVIRAARGNDLVCGGAGNDTLDGGRGNDRLLGGAGRDRLFGGPRADLCDGGPARDRARDCERTRRLR
jgi:uncharacterized delta-60 repeat protein